MEDNSLIEVVNYFNDGKLTKKELKLLSVEVSSYTSLCHYLLSFHKLIHSYQYLQEGRPMPLQEKFQKVLKSFQIGLYC